MCCRTPGLGLTQEDLAPLSTLPVPWFPDYLPFFVSTLLLSTSMNSTLWGFHIKVVV